MSDWSDFESVGINTRGALVLLGTALLVSSAVLGFSGLTDTHRHAAWEAGEEFRATDDVLVADDLSVQEQAIVLEAAASESSVWTAEPVGLHFNYPTEGETRHYVVDLGDQLYVLETSQVTRPVSLVTSSVQVGFAIAGSLFVLAGVVPILSAALAPRTPTRSVEALFDTYLPMWGWMILGLTAILTVAAPLVFETVVTVPFNLFVTPFVLATALCFAVTSFVLQWVEVPDAVFVASAVNVPAVWAVVVALAVAPGTGESRAALTLLLGIATLSVLVGQVAGWYTLRWLEFRRSEQPQFRPYWRI